ncbi:GAF and ANTAR domain-containing protein [Nocardia sp. NPDC088792]|uniref:GAF and ANTAR domain-containing protein n=1 Tax=Nocardia sp. NPDC088792 TaxID=3364332 RepID=UPI003802C9CA
MAALHRRIQARHLACASLHRRHAVRMQGWQAADDATLRPVFMTTVAEELGITSAALTLFGHRHETLLASASDAIARAARDLEFVVGEGPAMDAAESREPVFAAGAELIGRWPRYGPAITDLGVHAVAAVPLMPDLDQPGALCVYTAQAEECRNVVPAARLIVAALVCTLLDSLSTLDDEMPRQGALFDDAEFLTSINQACGRVAVRCRCDADTALALMRARAFSTDTALEEIARQVLEDECPLC